MILDYQNYFSREAIIKLIVGLRIAASFKQHKKYFWSEFEAPQVNLEEIYSYTPPRRLWVKPSRKMRYQLPVTKLNEWALTETIKRFDSKDQLWCQNLDKLVLLVQAKAYYTQQINKPKIVFLPKDEEFFRPLTLYSLEDHIYICLLAKYLVDLTDPYLNKSCIAFRGKEGQKIVGFNNYHEAIKQIIDYRIKNKDKSVYVTECDIKSFYDCVPHHSSTSEL